MSAIDWLSALLLVVGAAFFFAGTLGLLRFPDVYSRLHALAKADNLGLGCVLLGLALRADSLAVAMKLLLIWPLVLTASAGVGFAIARRAQTLGIRPWRQGDAP
ncbi:monovalent cation/H(+) antiporter subunit G [Thiorhodococcus minor]|uniref:Monovalent cation/H(+) antiporter subunit G n=1 Tax=Thiorhodococcus minor TaxID=57489 RepID=A0A6M0K3N0_9GAMM|nr:monovalent cation/H(+) antiporter subunit G [Thiorhodococcus minor]NEV63227.1 monovalent cation/H(+) antiporter subunit G [Thiorhodococcus minor]